MDKGWTVYWSLEEPKGPLKGSWGLRVYTFSVWCSVNDQVTTQVFWGQARLSWGLGGKPPRQRAAVCWAGCVLIPTRHHLHGAAVPPECLNDQRVKELLAILGVRGADPVPV